MFSKFLGEMRSTAMTSFCFDIVLNSTINFAIPEFSRFSHICQLSPVNPETNLLHAILILANNPKQQLNARFFRIKNKTVLQEDCQKAFKKLNLQDFCHKCSFFNSFTQNPALNCQDSPSVTKGKGLIPEELQSWGWRPGIFMDIETVEY